MPVELIWLYFQMWAIICGSEVAVTATSRFRRATSSSFMRSTFCSNDVSWSACAPGPGPGGSAAMLSKRAAPPGPRAAR